MSIGPVSRRHVRSEPAEPFAVEPEQVEAAARWMAETILSPRRSTDDWRWAIRACIDSDEANSDGRPRASLVLAFACDEPNPESRTHFLEFRPRSVRVTVAVPLAGGFAGPTEVIWEAKHDSR